MSLPKDWKFLCFGFVIIFLELMVLYSFWGSTLCGKKDDKYYYCRYRETCCKMKDNFLCCQDESSQLNGLTENNNYQGGFRRHNRHRNGKAESSHLKAFYIILASYLLSAVSVFALVLRILFCHVKSKTLTLQKQLSYRRIEEKLLAKSKKKMLKVLHA